MVKVTLVHDCFSCFLNCSIFKLFKLFKERNASQILKFSFNNELLDYVGPMRLCKLSNYRKSGIYDFSVVIWPFCTNVLSRNICLSVSAKTMLSIFLKNLLYFGQFIPQISACFWTSDSCFRYLLLIPYFILGTLFCSVLMEGPQLFLFLSEQVYQTNTFYLFVLRCFSLKSMKENVYIQL